MASALCRFTVQNAAKFVRNSVPIVTSIRHGSDVDVVYKDTNEGKAATPSRGFPNELGHSVGKQRYELMGIRSGVDVWDDQPHYRPADRGTFANPVIVKTKYNERFIGCISGIPKAPGSVDHTLPSDKSPKAKGAVGHSLASNQFELLEKFAGKEDPFQVAIRRTKTEPPEINYIQSMHEERLVGCICEEDSLEIVWWTLKKGSMVKCDCGYNFKLSGIDDDNYSPIKSQLTSTYY